MLALAAGLRWAEALGEEDLAYAQQIIQQDKFRVLR
jgi:hypothetical protein